MPRGCYYLYPGHKHHSSMFLTWKGEGGINIILCCLWWREKCLISSHNAIDPHIADLAILSSRVNKSRKDFSWPLIPSSAKLRTKCGGVAAGEGLRIPQPWNVQWVTPSQPITSPHVPPQDGFCSYITAFTLLFIAPPPSFPPLGIFTLGQSKARWHDFSVFPQDNEPGGFHWGTDMQVYIRRTSLFNVKESLALLNSLFRWLT